MAESGRPTLLFLVSFLGVSFQCISDDVGQLPDSLPNGHKRVALDKSGRSLTNTPAPSIFLGSLQVFNIR